MKSLPRKGELVFVTKKGMVSMGIDNVFIPEGVEETIRAFLFEDQVFASNYQIPGLPNIDEQTGLLLCTNVKMMENRRQGREGAVLQFVVLLQSKLWCLTIEMNEPNPNYEDYIVRRPK